MARVALLSNPHSTGNKSLLPRIREFCAANPDIFHYEVEHADQIGEALRTIARVGPSVLVINGGDGTVQAALTELHHGDAFGMVRPPVAVLPNGKTNLIALDLGAVGDPLTALARVLEMAKTDLAPHIVARELIALSDGSQEKPVLGMFLGGAGLADTMLFCRHKIYPLGLPNGVSHVLTAIAVLASLLLGVRGRFLPPPARPIRVEVRRDGVLTGRYALLLVTTLEKMLLMGPMRGTAGGPLKLLAVEQRALPLLRTLVASLRGRLGRTRIDGVHVESGDEIRIEGRNSSVILDGELFEADMGRPIILTPTAPVPFLRFAA